MRTLRRRESSTLILLLWKHATINRHNPAPTTPTLAGVSSIIISHIIITHIEASSLTRKIVLYASTASTTRILAAFRWIRWISDLSYIIIETLSIYLGMWHLHKTSSTCYSLMTLI